MVRHQWLLMIVLGCYDVGYYGFVMPRFRCKNSMSSVHNNQGVKRTTKKLPPFRPHLHHFTHSGTSLSSISQLSASLTDQTSLSSISQVSASLTDHILNMAISFLQRLANILKKLKPKAPIVQQTIKGEKVIVRPANVDDTSLVLDFILELADFEQLKDQVTATTTSLQEKLFPKDPSLPHPRVLILEVNDQPGIITIFFSLTLSSLIPGIITIFFSLTLSSPINI